ELGERTARFAPVDSHNPLNDAMDALGFPLVLKTRRLGYDGKGQQVVRRPADGLSAWQALDGAPLIAEELVHFDRELSSIALRGADGAIACYPLIENSHQGGILRPSLAPAATPQTQAAAELCATRALRSLDYVGVLAIEFFDVAGQLLVNEMAPRVHNS